MEVHHHPHVEKKNFKEYLLEGLMIFLAVTMGFFAESIRENISDREKETEFMKSLLHDIKVDQSRIDSAIAQSNLLNMFLDSLSNLANSGACFSHTSDFYFYGRYVTRYASFVADSRTLDEMKSGGWFRVIKNKKVADSIMEYYASLPQIEAYEERLRDQTNEYRKIAVQVYDPSIFGQILVQNSLKRQAGNPALRVKDTKLLLDLSGFALYMHSLHEIVIQTETDLHANGEALIKLIQKEYHLANE